MKNVSKAYSKICNVLKNEKLTTISSETEMRWREDNIKITPIKRNAGNHAPTQPKSLRIMYFIIRGLPILFNKSEYDEASKQE